MKNSLFIFALLCSFLFNPVQLNAVDKNISIGNELFKKQFSFEQNKIVITSLFDKKLGRELLQAQSGKPYFEFVLNHHKISSNDPLWSLQEVKTRKMSNGGTELSISVWGKNELKELHLLILQQYFPNSTLIREQLLLKSNKTGSMRLNKLQDKLHFVFPQYAFANTAPTDSINEIRMASFGNEILPELDSNRTYDNRVKDRNLAACHMFHTATLVHALSVGENSIQKGPFDLTRLDHYTILSTYEHASQDGIKGMRAKETGGGNEFASIIDADQGVKANSGYIAKDEDFFFVGTHHQKEKSATTISNRVLRGAYLENEAIPTDKYYRTVWSATAFMTNLSFSKDLIRNYILNQITEHKPARTPSFYYNTWGMQRNSDTEGKDMRSIFTESRILEEMDYAAQLNVDHFVLDDGWQETLGLWEYNKKRLPNGLQPFIDRAKEKNMKLGVWFSFLGIDSTTQRYKEHPDWVIRSIDGKPAIGQWDNPVFDVVGDFSKLIVEDHKKLIDQGIKFFKWDAINTFNSALPNLWHGDGTYDRKEIIDRYNYLLPFVVTDCMKQLREYDPEVCVEIDVTEPERCLVGLMPLQEGKLFWMNNGASGYGDYSTFRTKSMRTIINQLGNILPPEVFTYAQYPQNMVPFHVQRYNVNTSLIAGSGFWGSLKLMSKSDRVAVGKTLTKAKMVLPYINGKPLLIQGQVGATPEMYEQIDVENAFGQVIGFSGSAKNYTQHSTINGANLLCALNQSYRLVGNSLDFDFQFTIPDDTREAFILGNEGKEVSIVESSGWIDEVKLGDNGLDIKMGAVSVLKIKLPLQAKYIKVNDQSYERGNDGLLRIEASPVGVINIRWEK